MSIVARDWRFHWALVVVVLCALVDRAWMVHTTMNYASDDLTVVWLGATDYARGIFHEPFFYGQDYGVMLEALIAAPFVALGCNPTPTVAIIFGVFALAPYLSIAVYHWHRKAWWPALLFAAMPLLLPVEHGLQITALNGLALIALVPLAWCIRPLLWQTAGLILVLSLAVFINPNAALVALPMVLHHGMQHRGNYKTYLGAALGLVPVLLLWTGARAFFHAQTAETVNTIFDWRMHFKPYMIGEAFKRLDVHFEWLAPLSGQVGSMALVLCMAAILLLFAQRNVQVALALVATLGLIMLAFCFAKVHDGSGSIFFPLSRIFLGMPLVLAWAWGAIRIEPSHRHGAIVLVATVAVLHGSWRVARAQQVYDQALQHQEDLPVRTWSVDRIKARCTRLASLANTVQADRIVLLRGNDPFPAQFTAYSLPVFHPEAPSTWMVGHDRRILQRQAMELAAVGHAMIVDIDATAIHRLAGLGITTAYVSTTAPPAVVITSGEHLSLCTVLKALH